MMDSFYRPASPMNAMADCRHQPGCRADGFGNTCGEAWARPRMIRRHEWKKLPRLSTMVPNSPASNHTPLQLGQTSISTESHVSVASSWPHFGQCIQCSSFRRSLSACVAPAAPFPAWPSDSAVPAPRYSSSVLVRFITSLVYFVFLGHSFCQTIARPALSSPGCLSEAYCLAVGCARRRAQGHDRRRRAGCLDDWHFNARENCGWLDFTLA